MAAVSSRDHGLAGVTHPDDTVLGPVQLFARLTDVERNQAELRLQIAHSGQSLATAMQALQVDMDRLVKIGEKQVDLQHAAAETSSGLERLATSVDLLIDETKDRWRLHEDAHEKRDVAHALIAERVTMFRGALLALVLLGGLLTTLAGLYFQSQLANVREIAQGAAKAYQQDRDRLENRMDRLDGLFRESQLK